MKVVLLAVSLLACSTPPERSRSGTEPTVGDARLAAVFDDLRQDPHSDLKGVLVRVDGKLAGEAYFNGDGPEALHDFRSAGKSITSLLAGIAIDRGWIAGVDRPLSELLGPAVPPELAAITLRDLLTMRSGLSADDTDPESPGNEDRMDATDDWLQFALAVPPRSPPGRSYQYASVNAFLVGAIIERAAGMPLRDVAARHLFAPLGIARFEWRRGPRGEGAGQGNLSLRLRDAAAIGQMVLDGGRVGGVEVVGERWLGDSLAEHVPIAAVDRYADQYGYMWYRKTHTVDGSPVLVHFASGNGGNKIYLVPSRRMVVAISSSAYGRPHGQPRSEQILLSILAAPGG